jgi:hypothetical protein
VRAGFPRAAHNYLLHSAGSGKTKENAWLAHDLDEAGSAERCDFFALLVGRVGAIFL